VRERGCSVYGFGSASSSLSEDSLEGRPAPRSRLRFAFAASQHLDDTCAFLASRSTRYSASSDSCRNIAVLVRAHAASTNLLVSFFVGTTAGVDVDGAVHTSVVMGELEMAASGAKPGRPCLEVDTNLAECNGSACDAFADTSTSKTTGYRERKDRVNERENI
jgi:hypothetical protein